MFLYMASMWMFSPKSVFIAATPMFSRRRSKPLYHSVAAGSVKSIVPA